MSRTIFSVSLVTDRPELTKFVTMFDTLVVTSSVDHTLGGVVDEAPDGIEE